MKSLLMILAGLFVSWHFTNLSADGFGRSIDNDPGGFDGGGD